jgi:hypothetical protein
MRIRLFFFCNPLSHVDMFQHTFHIKKHEFLAGIIENFKLKMCDIFGWNFLFVFEMALKFIGRLSCSSGFYSQLFTVYLNLF